MFRNLILLVVLAMTACLTASAQLINGEKSHVYRKGGELFTSSDAKIDKSTALQYMSSDTYYEYYLKGHKLFRSGIIVSSIGAGIVVGTLAFDLINHAAHPVNPEKPTKYVPVVSITGAIVGGTMLLVSIPLYAVGTVKLNKAAELSFISPSGGMGLVLNF